MSSDYFYNFVKGEFYKVSLIYLKHLEYLKGDLEIEIDSGIILKGVFTHFQ